MNNKYVLMLKAQWMPLSLLLAVLIALPLSYYFSDSWHRASMKKVQDVIDADAKEINGAKVTYGLTPLIPGGEKVELATNPNQILTDFFKAEREKQSAQATQLYEEAWKLNAGKRLLPDGSIQTLEPGLLPQPSDAELDVKRYNLLRTFSELFPRRQLDRAKAGLPPDRDVIAREVMEAYQTLVKAKLPTGKNDPKLLADADWAEIREKLAQLRIERTKAAALRMSFYADQYIFRVPQLSQYQDKQPSLAQCFDWQIQSYVMEDIFAAIALVNDAANTGGVPAAVVKRVEDIGVFQRFGREQAASAPAAPGAEAAPTVAVAGTEVPPDGGTMPVNYANSITGRVSGPGTGNNLYDLRPAEIKVVVSAKNLPKFLNALAQTNFISVLDVDLLAVDSNDELKKGYYYGEEPVLRATIRLETLWMREWTRKIMPKEVRDELGVPDPNPPAAADPNAPAPAAPAAPATTPAPRG